MAQLITWEGVMKSALSMPLVKVDRNSFLRQTFYPYGMVDKLQNQRPQDIYSPKVIDNVTKGIIKNHLTKVTLLSAAAGIPGGPAVFATIPADMAQFFWHYLVMAQKLAYVYGWTDLTDEENNLGEEAQSILTLFVGIGFGVEVAQNVIEAVLRQTAKEAMKKIPRMALAKTWWYPILKKIAPWITGKLTKDSFAKGVGKVVPFLGGPLSGSLTYFSFKGMAKKLNTSLLTTSKEFKEEPKDS